MLCGTHTYTYKLLYSTDMTYILYTILILLQTVPLYKGGTEWTESVRLQYEGT